MEKSKKVPPRRSKDGGKYVVVRLLPKDQLKAFRSGTGCYSCRQFEEEKKDEFCLHYHDYENFYNNWIIGSDTFHLD